jgi:hypothetical protein
VINRELKEDLVTGVSSTKAQRDPRGPTPLEMNRNPLGGIDRLLKLESTLNEEGVGPPFTFYKLGIFGGSWVHNDQDICKQNTHLASVR